MADTWIYKVRSNTLQKRLLADLEKGIYTDVTIKVGPDENQCTFKAHRLVLASENSVLEKILHGSDSGKIEVPDVHPKAFENLIRYCYGESFRFKDLESIRDTYLAAEKFKAKKLQLAAENNLIDLLKSEPLRSLIKILKVGIELNMPRAKERCLVVISTQLEKVWMSSEFLEAPIEVIEPILCLCADRGRDCKASALSSIMEWAKRHSCSDGITHRLISMVQCKNIPSDVILSCNRKGEPLSESWFGTVPKSLSLNEVCCRTKNLSLNEVCCRTKNLFPECTNVVGNAAASLEASEVESSEELETLLEEEKVVTDDVQVSGLKDKKEIAVEQAETSKLGGEKMNGDYDSDEDDSLLSEEIIKDLIQQAKDLIKQVVECTSEETKAKIERAAEKVSRHAAEKLQKAVDDMQDSFKYLNSSNSHAAQERSECD